MEALALYKTKLDGFPSILRLVKFELILTEDQIMMTLRLAKFQFLCNLNGMRLIQQRMQRSNSS